MSQNNPFCLSTNPRGREPGPLSRDEPCDSDVRTCAMPRGARAPESGDRRGVDAKEKPSPFCCVGIEEKSSDGERESASRRWSCSGALFSRCFACSCLFAESGLLKHSERLIAEQRAGYRLAFFLAFDVVSSFVDNEETFFDPDLQLFSFFLSHKKKKKKAPREGLLLLLPSRRRLPPFLVREHEQQHQHQRRPHHLSV